MLLSRMELCEKGVPQDEIDLMLPLKKVDIVELELTNLVN